MLYETCSLCNEIEHLLTHCFDRNEEATYKIMRFGKYPSSSGIGPLKKLDCKYLTLDKMEEES